jgi:hypothetical protein
MLVGALILGVVSFQLGPSKSKAQLRMGTPVAGTSDAGWSSVSEVGLVEPNLPTPSSSTWQRIYIPGMDKCSWTSMEAPFSIRCGCPAKRSRSASIESASMIE